VSTRVTGALMRPFRLAEGIPAPRAGLFEPSGVFPDPPPLGKALLMADAEPRVVIDALQRSHRSLAKMSFLAHQCGAGFFREIECFGQIVSLPLAPLGASSGKAPKDFHPLAKRALCLNA